MPQLCNGVELLQCVDLEMVVWVAEWGCIFEMDVDGVVVGYACGVALVEEETMVAVEQVVEEKKWEECCTGASTPAEVHSTEVVAEHKNETNEQLVGHNMDL